MSRFSAAYSREVLFTVAQFAFLVHRTEENIRFLLRDGKLKGVQHKKKSCWYVPESELVHYWGRLYGKAKGGSGKGGTK